MSIRKVIGWVIIGAFGVAMLAGMVADIGWLGAAIVLGACGLLWLGLWLLWGDLLVDPDRKAKKELRKKFLAAYRADSKRPMTVLRSNHNRDTEA